MDWAVEEGAVDDADIRERLEDSSGRSSMAAKGCGLWSLTTCVSIEKQVLLQTIDRKWREHLCDA